MNDGGPAFPNSHIENDGMSLRDWLAGQAIGKCLHEFWGEEDCNEATAIVCYQIADAMLAARAVGREEK